MKYIATIISVILIVVMSGCTENTVLNESSSGNGATVTEIVVNRSEASNENSSEASSYAQPESSKASSSEPSSAFEVEQASSQSEQSSSGDVSAPSSPAYTDFIPSEPIKVLDSKPVLTLELSKTNVVLNGLYDEEEVSVATNGVSSNIILTTTNGIKASYNHETKSITISAENDGSVIVKATEPGYVSDELEITVTLNLPVIKAATSNSKIDIYGADDVVELPVEISNVNYADVEVTATNGAKAYYNETGANGGNIVISASKDATVTVRVSAHGYSSVSTKINVSYHDLQVPLNLSKASLSVEHNEVAYVTVDTGEVTGADIQIKNSGGVNASYQDGQIEVSATGSGTITVTAMKSGFASTSREITVSYQPYIPEPTVPQAETNEFEQEVLRLINKVREDNGLTPFGTSSNLNYYADIRADDLQELYSHDRPNGDTFYSIFTETEGNNTYGENIAEGQSTPEEVVNDWMNSQGHKDNILNPNFDEMAVGISTNSEGRISWVQLFWGRK